MVRRARFAAALGLLLVGCQSVIERGVTARQERRELNLAFTIEDNLLRLTTVTLAGREGRYFLGTAQPRTIVHPTFVPAAPRRLALGLGRRDTLEIEPLYIDLTGVGDAIIGFDTWSPRAITINYVSGMVTYQTGTIETDGMTVYRFEDEPAIQVVIDGRRIAAAVDTMIPDTLILPRGESAAGRTKVHLEIADVAFVEIDVALADVSRARIGNRLLSKFLVSIDYGGRRVALWRDPRVPLQ
ncbi:MAG TPA: hypothetical protein VM779_00785 [Thermoanaerobaculia bacterium]|nr:hypothetical protein [Thermoanaerobaculia bacterium]